MNVYGELFSAQLENLSASPGATLAGRVWYRSDINSGTAQLDTGALVKQFLLNDQKIIVGTNVTAATNARLYRSGTGWLSLVLASDTTAEGSTSATLARLSAFVTSRTNITFSNTPYTVLTTDTHIDVDTSGGAVTVVIPAAAAGNNGQVVWIRKTTSDFTAVTITTGISTTLNTTGECIQCQSNGTTWVVVNRYTPSYWVAYTPAGTFVSNATYTGLYKREGDSLRCRVNIAFAGGTTATTLSGITIPATLAIDTAKILNTVDGETRVGEVTCRDSGNSTWTGYALYQSSTLIRPQYLNNTPNLAGITQVAPFTFLASDSINIEFLVPISGWNG